MMIITYLFFIEKIIFMQAGQILALIAVVLSTSLAQAKVGKNEQVADPNIVNDNVLSALPVLNAESFNKIVAARPMTRALYFVD